MKILVTGSNGQLGQCLQKHAKSLTSFDFKFETLESLDLTQENTMNLYFEKHRPDFCVNCAAYTNVEGAEDNEKSAFQVNAEAVHNLAKLCEKFKTKLIHISTDYVFDGLKNRPYHESDKESPINVYGTSKFQGETYISSTMDTYFILRTSWLYSEFGPNFFNTILKKAAGQHPLHITTEQIGTPTNANDLAKFILYLIRTNSTDYGLYHYSNKGEATWYDFARLILEEKKPGQAINLKATFSYPTKAKRPKFSVIDKSKALSTFGIEIPHWRESLVNLIKEMG
jgi:dTDP-4-dehydrorhamnose reductase